MAATTWDELAAHWFQQFADREANRGAVHFPPSGERYASKDPGTYRYKEGEVESDVGFLDPVDLLAGLLAPGALQALTPAYRRSVPLGKVRLYRGETTKPSVELPAWIAESPTYQATRQATGRWWTDDPAIAQWYVEESAPHGRMVWQDVPRDVANQSHLPRQPLEIRRFSRNPEHEWFLPEDYAGRGEVLPQPSSRLPQPLRPILHSQRGSISDVTSVAERLRMLRTARARGNVGQEPTLVTRATLQRAAPDERILDYGAGHGARQTAILREAGYTSVTPTDLPESIALSEGRLQAIPPGTTYDTAMASNVLNVQPHRAALEETLRELIAYLHPEGRAIMNYPQSPRYPGLTAQEIDALLRTYFREVDRIAGTSNAPVFEGRFPLPGRR